MLAILILLGPGLLMSCWKHYLLRNNDSCAVAHQIGAYLLDLLLLNCVTLSAAQLFLGDTSRLLSALFNWSAASPPPPYDQCFCN